MFSESPKEQLSPEKNPENRRGSRRGTAKDRKVLLLSPAPYTYAPVFCTVRVSTNAASMHAICQNVNLVRVKRCSLFVFRLPVLKVLNWLEGYYDNPNCEIELEVFNDFLINKASKCKRTLREHSQMISK